MSAATDNNRIDSEINRLLKLPYTRELKPNSDGTWFAKVTELPGCMTEGDTPDEAIEELNDAMSAWMRSQLQDGEQVPEPTPADVSGKFVVRLPKTVHYLLARRAELEGVSLNQWVVTTLAKSLGAATEASGGESRTLR